jgi:ferritin-like metal-binding protein YciE
MLIIKKYIGPDELKKFFISHLNKLYSAIAHLVNRLPELGAMAHLGDLKNAIADTTDRIEKQISFMNDIYNLLNAKISSKNHKGLIGMVEDAFVSIKQQTNPVQRDMSMLFYLQNIESVEMTSLQALQVVAVKLKNDQIKKLLKQNFDSAKADKALLQMITVRYVTG